MPTTKQAKQIKEILDRGRVYAEDEKGYKLALYARCPNDQTESPVLRVIKTDSTTQMVASPVFRCPVCFAEFEADTDDMLLQ